LICRAINVSPTERGKEEMKMEMYVYLTRTAHGSPVWFASEEGDMRYVPLPDRGVHCPPPVRVLGPIEVGPSGYASVEEANEMGVLEVDLNDPGTWFEE
jgi:hypothetical protein